MTKDNSTTYSAYELYPDGSEEYVGQFTMSYLKGIELLSKHNLNGHSMTYAYVIAMFETVYNFTKGPNGFNLYWIIDGISGSIRWRQDTWVIKKVEEDVEPEPIQD